MKDNSKRLNPYKPDPKQIQIIHNALWALRILTTRELIRMTACLVSAEYDDPVEAATRMVSVSLTGEINRNALYYQIIKNTLNPRTIDLNEAIKI